MERLRTGNAIFDALVRAVAIALIAAIFVWVLGMLDAPNVLDTIIWILALLAIAAVIFPLAAGGASPAGDRPGPPRDPTAPGGQHPAEHPTAPPGQAPTGEPTPRGRRPPPGP